MNVGVLFLYTTSTIVDLQASDDHSADMFPSASSSRKGL